MRTQILDCPVDVLSREETIELARRSMQERQPCMHVSLNVAKLVTQRTDGDLARDIASADIVGIDGMGITLAMRLTGHKSAPRFAGVDLFEELMALCAREGLKPFLLGAKQEILEEAMRRLQIRFPGLEFAGAHHGYFDGRDEEVVSIVRASGADCLFLAMPSPRKERFMARWRSELAVPFVMGIGGTLDVMAGKVSRAPAMLQALGLEWFYRLVQEPRRMWRRYLKTNAQFASLLLREIFTRRGDTAAAANPGKPVN
jgi:N-acetylglucosaminyldiphosphoundecaprenol N-acetyl-beta-D-mannosaminyltransferase